MLENRGIDYASLHLIFTRGWVANLTVPDMSAFSDASEHSTTPILLSCASYRSECWNSEILSNRYVFFILLSLVYRCCWHVRTTLRRNSDDACELLYQNSRGMFYIKTYATLGAPYGNKKKRTKKGQSDAFKVAVFENLRRHFVVPKPHFTQTSRVQDGTEQTTLSNSITWSYVKHRRKKGS